MISSVVSPEDMHGMKINMLADGLFDLFCWIVTIIAIVLLFREASSGSLPSARSYIGDIFIGGGFFNLIEGSVDHELLRIHHVRTTEHWLLWDLGFLLIFGLGFIAVGFWLRRSQPPATLSET